MLLIIPSIDITNGKCAYRIIGEKGTEIFYNEIENHPEKLCKLFRKENVKTIHVTDFDSYSMPNYDFQKIFELTKATFLPFQLHANFYDLKYCGDLLENGIHRLVFDDIDRYDFWGLRNLILKYTNHRIIFYLPILNNSVKFKYSDKQYELNDYLYKIHSIGGVRVIYNEIDMPEGKYYKPSNLNLVRHYISNITLSADISDFKELIKFNDTEEFGFDSVIIGKPFYENSFSCQKIWRMIESEVDI